MQKVSTTCLIQLFVAQGYGLAVERALSGVHITDVIWGRRGLEVPNVVMAMGIEDTYIYLQSVGRHQGGSLRMLLVVYGP